MTLETLLKYGGYFVATIILIVSLVRQYRSGNFALKKESDNIRQQIIDNLEKRNIQLVQENKESKELHERDRKDLQSQVSELGNRLSKLTGIVEEKDKLIKSLNETILNRNPALEETLTAIKNFLELIYKQGVAQNIKTEEQTVMIKSQVKREDGIDKSTDQKVGNIMRKGKI